MSNNYFESGEWDFEMYGDRMPIPRGDHDTEFRYHDFDGKRILEGDINHVLDLLVVIIGKDVVIKSPYSARKELNNITNKIEKIKNSKYCQYASNKDEILDELSPLESAVNNLSDRAYDILEWDV